MLWDRRERRIVNNESSEIIRMFETGVLRRRRPGPLPAGARGADRRHQRARLRDRQQRRLPLRLRAHAGRLRGRVRPLFETLDWLEALLGERRYLLGDALTEADWRLFPTLVRFDAVYYGHFKCNLRRLVDYPNLWGYTRELYQLPGIAATVADRRDQAPLLRDAPADQPDADRAARAAARLHDAARARRAAMSAERTRPQPPPGLERALERFVAALGAEHVLHAASSTSSATRSRTAAGRTAPPPRSCCPRRSRRSRRVVRIAAEHAIPLWTSSTGRNNGYGGGGPLLGGSVVVSLRRMNRVLELDRELGYALVEPGVRWFDLHEAIEAAGADLMVSVADLGWGGPVGNLLENGVTYLPYGVDWSWQCGMEVVLGDGEVLRTGMGAMPGNRAWNLYKRGLGPTLDPLFTQSNFGIVTKLGVWLMPKPEVYMPMWLQVRRDDDIAPLIDTLRRLALDGTLQMVPTILNALNHRGAAHPPRRLVRRRGADPRGGDRPHRARARDRPLADALRALRRRCGRRAPLREGPRGDGADPRERADRDALRARQLRRDRGPRREDHGRHPEHGPDPHHALGRAATPAGTSASRRSCR